MHFKRGITAILTMSLVLLSTTWIQASALEAPAWVPKTVEGYSLVYNGTIPKPTLPGGIEMDLDMGGSENVVSNWTQIWLKNTSLTNIEGVVAVVLYEYKEDYFSKPIPTDWATAINALGTQEGLPAFKGTTRWDLFMWMMNMSVSQGFGSGLMDEKANITGSTGAFSMNISMGGADSFYLLYAYAGTKAMMILSMAIPSFAIDTDGLTPAEMALLEEFFKTYVVLIVICFSAIMSMFTTLDKIGPGAAAVPSTSSAGNPVPRVAAGSMTSAEVKQFANQYVPAAAGTGGIPGFPVAALGVFSLLAVFVVARKRKVAVA